MKHKKNGTHKVPYEIEMYNSKVKSRSFLLQIRSLVISADSLAIAAARRTETTACPVDLDAINLAESPLDENYFDGRLSVGHTLYSVCVCRSFKTRLANWLVCNFNVSRPAR